MNKMEQLIRIVLISFILVFIYKGLKVKEIELYLDENSKKTIYNVNVNNTIVSYDTYNTFGFTRHVLNLNSNLYRIYLDTSYNCENNYIIDVKQTVKTKLLSFNTLVGYKIVVCNENQ